MLSPQSDVVRRLRIPGYLVLALLVFLPLIELTASAWPPNFHQAAWRFTMVGAGANATVNTLLGLFLISAIAIAAGDRTVVWFVAVIAAIGAALCFVGAGILPLDAVQLRGQVTAAALPRYGIAWGLALLKIISTAIVFLTLAISSFRSAKAMGMFGSRSKTKGTPLVVANPAGRAPAPPSAGGVVNR